jgi:hypothetical protein
LNVLSAAFHALPLHRSARITRLLAEARGFRLQNCLMP